ncbi:MAG: efflux RND transporter periplasmic adaptor subunit [Verrucomicrobiota bacterium]
MQIFKQPARASLAVIAGLATLTACSRPQAPNPPAPKVTVAQPQIMVVTNWDEFPGHLEAVETVEIRARVFGYLHAIQFTDGAEVKAGDLLFLIDPKPYQADLERAQAERQRTHAEYQRTETHAELAMNDLKRAESLRGTKAISEEEYDNRSKAVHEAQAAQASAKAAEAAAQAAESVAQLNLSYTRIKAPISGRIGRRQVTVGNLIQGGNGTSTVLATIVTTDPIYCYFDADELSFLRYRSSGSAGTGTGPNAGSVVCALALVNEDGFPHPGRLDFFDNQVDAKTGTIRMRAVFDNADRALLPGMFGRLRLPAGKPEATMLIPADAISSDQGNKFVLTVNKDSVVVPRPIKVGRQHGGKRTVLEGLTTEDRIVVNGLMMARPGSKVQVVPPVVAGTPASPAATK